MGLPEPNQSNNEEETTDVSLITGALRTTNFPTSSEITNGTLQSTSLVPRNESLTVANTNTAGTEPECVSVCSFFTDSASQRSILKNVLLF